MPACICAACAPLPADLVFDSLQQRHAAGVGHFALDVGHGLLHARGSAAGHRRPTGNVPAFFW